jgi:transposase
MRGRPAGQAQLSFLQPEHVVPVDHPLRPMKREVDAILRTLEPTLAQLYATTGRPSIPPEALLKATLLMALFSVRSERLFCEQLAYNWLFRWFLELDNSASTWDHSTFSKNRARLLEADLAGKFFDAVVALLDQRGVVRDEHFTVDGTLIDAWASRTTVHPRPLRTPEDPDYPGPPSNGVPRLNDQFASILDPEARLASKGGPGRLYLQGHALIDSATGLCLGFQVTPPTGRSEVEAALALLRTQRLRGCRSGTVAADKAYDTAHFRDRLAAQGLTCHVAYKKSNHPLDPAPPAYTTTPEYAQSQHWRRRIERVFGWLKTVAGLRKSRFIGVAKTEFYAHMSLAAYNLLRLQRLAPA